jgi:phosphatidylserine/phosphatidylglycerophosphate/cardiolipin synthase-like enzyme
MSLTSVSSRDLEAFLRALESGDVDCPLSATDLQASGLGRLVGRVDGLASLDEGAVRTVLQLILDERRADRGPAVELVWSGPEAPGSLSRDTLVVVRRLFEEAEQRVLIGGYSFIKGTEVLRVLHQAMLTRGVAVDVFVDVERVPIGADVEKYIGLQIQKAFVKWWSFGSPRPRIYYDRRALDARAYPTNMHAKCVVVDDRVSFVGSANFTEQAYKHNVEVGVLVRDPGFTQRLSAQWVGLVESGLLQEW